MGRPNQPCYKNSPPYLRFTSTTIAPTTTLEPEQDNDFFVIPVSGIFCPVSTTTIPPTTPTTSTTSSTTTSTTTTVTTCPPAPIPPSCPYGYEYIYDQNNCLIEIRCLTTPPPTTTTTSTTSTTTTSSPRYLCVELLTTTTTTTTLPPTTTSTTSTTTCGPIPALPFCPYGYEYIYDENGCLLGAICVTTTSTTTATSTTTTSTTTSSTSTSTTATSTTTSTTTTCPPILELPPFCPDGYEYSYDENGCITNVICVTTTTSTTTTTTTTTPEPTTTTTVQPTTTTTTTATTTTPEPTTTTTTTSAPTTTTIEPTVTTTSTTVEPTSTTTTTATTEDPTYEPVPCGSLVDFCQVDQTPGGDPVCCPCGWIYCSNPNGGGYCAPAGWSCTTMPPFTTTTTTATTTSTTTTTTTTTTVAPTTTTVTTTTTTAAPYGCVDASSCCYCEFSGSWDCNYAEQCTGIFYPDNGSGTCGCTVLTENPSCDNTYCENLGLYLVIKYCCDGVCKPEPCGCENSCTWTWYADGPAWFTDTSTNPCGIYCTCPYPTFNGSVDGETTITECN